jgi:hypothetical protein
MRAVFLGVIDLRSVAVKCRKPFVVAAPAPMLKRNPTLSKNARNLYMTMWTLADGKTGELRINGRWLQSVVIDRAAEMCRDIRMKCMRELIALGLVSFDRERVERFVKGRKRVVLGRTRYCVHRRAQIQHYQQNVTPNRELDGSEKPNDFGGPVPKIIKTPNVLLKSISSTVEEIDSQILSVTPIEALPSAFGFRVSAVGHVMSHPIDRSSQDVPGKPGKSQFKSKTGIPRVLT